MAFSPISPSKQRSFPVLFLLFLFLIFLVMPSIPPRGVHINVYKKRDYQVTTPPSWYRKVVNELGKEKIRLGLVNINDDVAHRYLAPDESVVQVVSFDRVRDGTRWEDLFPEWVDEDERWGPMTCPEIPMPVFDEYLELDLVVARVPEGVRDVYRLQVNLVVANLLVKLHEHIDGRDRDQLYVVFIGSSGPMWEIFRCDDLIWHEGEYRVYKPDLRRLKHKVAMPVGSCQLSPPMPLPRNSEGRKAYVTVLHSSESYVCGAIALAQSIIRTNSEDDLVLLADHSISTKSIRGLEAAGWKIKRIQRIRSPHAKIGAYNEYNYSKLRIWQLTEYDKVIFIDADLVVLRNIDHLFAYPQLSAVGNDKFLFNSGIMLVEPSACMFEALMAKTFTLASYNGGDQGFLNEAFTWWHRWHSTVNYLKFFVGEGNINPKHEIPQNPHTIHYLGLKPWMCYKDYDCNWDMPNHHHFASDSAHRRWWQVYEAMPGKLRSFCGLTQRVEERIRKWRGIAKSANLSDGHWKLEVKDRRRHRF